MRYWLYRKIFGIPCRSEIADIYFDKDVEEWSDKVCLACDYYIDDMDINQVAYMMNSTRERVKQRLWKAWRMR